MPLPTEKRTIDMEIIGQWVQPRTHVLDLGCGRGELLTYLKQTKDIAGIGVDQDFRKITECVRRGVTAYQGDIHTFTRSFDDGHFDHVICSRTVQELSDPSAVILEALRVSRAVTVGFVNYGYWRNRFDALLRGRKPRNAIYTTEWFESRPANPLTIADFEHFCAVKQIRILRRAHLLGDWKSPCHWRANLRAGYALYELSGQ